MTAAFEPFPSPITNARVVGDMRRWLRKAVIGLNLCPFAKAVQVKHQIHWVVSSATSRTPLLAELKRELLALAAYDAQVRDTTLWVVPDALSDFLEFNDFLQAADRLLLKLQLDGTLQIASFHPHYAFADTPGDDITNYTNRAPYPTLHLLRESSVARAVQAFPEANLIFDKNRQTLRNLGAAGWAALGVGATPLPTGGEPKPDN